MTTQTFAASMCDFNAAVADLLNGKAEGKGYSSGGDSGGRKMLDLVSDAAGEGHAPGEILYKLARYRAARNPEDLVKVAAWAFLMWDQHMRRAGAK